MMFTQTNCHVLCSQLGECYCLSLVNQTQNKWQQIYKYKVIRVSEMLVMIQLEVCGLVGLLHGDMTQGNRDDVIAAFKQNKFPILIATDVAGQY